MNKDFNERYLKKTVKDEIIFKQKSPLLYKKKGADLLKLESSKNAIIDKEKDAPTILLPVQKSSSISFKSDELRKAQLEKEIEVKKKAIEEAMYDNNKLQEKITKLKESLTHKDDIIREIEESILSFEAENKRLREEIEAKANEQKPNNEREGGDRRGIREINNLLNILLNIRRIRLAQEEHHQYPNPDNMTYEELLELEDKIGNVCKGLPSEKIKKIKMREYSCKRYKNDKCIICQFEFKENEQVKVLSCDHCFHNDCLDEWLKNEKKCPVCKKEVIV